MDRFVVREPRIGADFPQGNQFTRFGLNTPRNNNMIPPENMYLGGYGREYPLPNHMGSPGFFGIQQQLNTANYSPQPVALHPGQTQMVSGIDPRYLAAYSDVNAQFIATGQNIQNELPSHSIPVNFGSNYENRNFSVPERNKAKILPPHYSNVSDTKKHEKPVEEKTIYNTSFSKNPIKKEENQFGLPFQGTQQLVQSFPSKSSIESKVVKEESAHNIVSRAEKLKALHKTGTRAFSGPVEKVLKWHKVLQEIGVMVIYEIVAKCVSVRPGESCAKNLVVRDDSGPAMQVVYYEIDFLLPELKPPCTVRVVGRMMPGTCRLQAFNVRPATGDDVSTLPRRAAVASHHVAKLCKEFGLSPAL